MSAHNAKQCLLFVLAVRCNMQEDIAWVGQDFCRRPSSSLRSCCWYVYPVACMRPAVRLEEFIFYPRLFYSLRDLQGV